MEPSLFQRPDPPSEPASGPTPAAPGPDPTPTRTTRPIVVVAILVLIALVAAFLFVQHNRHDSRRASIALGGRTTASLQVDSGADRITVTTADLGGDLAVVTTSDGSGAHPKMSIDGQRVRVWTEDDNASGDGDQAAKTGPVEITIRIAKQVRWDVAVDKGARQIALALGSGRIHSIAVSGGADHADIILPRPDGELVTHIPTGLGGISLHAPTGVPVQITFGSGAGSAVVDGQTHQGIAAGTVINGTSGDPAAVNRLVVDEAAGVGTLTLDRAVH